ncbi:hypothetical protein HK098_007520 [Nowakowskiella sp. JEL0407]|nr:hypothetical protein HK098_007520 [Nowakowskiella sp. JEL0407]
MSTYDVFLSYCAHTDAETAKILYKEFESDQFKNTKVFWDSPAVLGSNWKEQRRIDALKSSRVVIPVISKEFFQHLTFEEGKDDFVLLEWDTIIEQFENGSGQLIIPLYVGDDTGRLDFREGDLAMKPLRAKDCKQTAAEIWDYFKDSQIRMIDIRDSNQVKFFLRDIQDSIAPTRAKPIQFNLYEVDDPEIFIDCAKVISEILKVFVSENVCNLKGLGGSGKTFVANKCAFLMLANGYIIAKFTADSESNLIRDVDEYLKYLLNVDKLPLRTGRINDYLQLLNSSNLPKQFIILDNVKQIKDIAEFLRSTNSNIKFLITSRTFITRPAITKNFYSEEACIEYLRRQTDRGFSDQQLKQVYDITNGFPLRLAIAARTLCDPAESLADYLADVNRKKSAMNLNFNPDHDSSDDVDELFPEFSLSIDKLTQKVSEGLQYLALLVKLEPDLIIEKYLVESVEEFQKQTNGSLHLSSELIVQSRREALKLGIIELVSDFVEDESKVAIRIHRVVQAEIRDRVKQNKSLESAVSQISQLYELKTKVFFEFTVIETSEKNLVQFDKYVDTAIKVCKLPLFKAAFLSTVIFEYLFPMSNQPYNETNNEEIEEKLWSDFMKLHNLVKGRKKSYFASLLKEVSPLLNGFEYDVKKGSYDGTLLLDRRVVRGYLAEAVTEVYNRTPMFLAVGPPTNTGVSVVINRDFQYQSAGLRITKANITQNGNRVNLFPIGTGLITPYALNFERTVRNSRNTGSSGRLSTNNLSRFRHLNTDFRNKVIDLRKDVFPPSEDPCREEEHYHDVFIRLGFKKMIIILLLKILVCSYRREPKSEMVRDWITIALEKISHRKNPEERPFHWFIDEDCLESGWSFSNQFLDALLHAKVVVLIITEETLKRLTASKKDNVVLEWEWALYLKKLHSKGKFRIQPLFIGKNNPIEDFDFGQVSQLLEQNDLSVKHTHHLSPRELSLKDVIDTVFDFQGELVDFKRKAIIQ